YQSAVTIHMGTASIDALKPMELTGLNIREGDPVTVTVEGPDEAEAARALEQFFKDNL
ncbi:MAG TPA: HPr family phosphocarrier protein, partial [Candidatus Gemmiger faecigallinarum]|nr:HPr family phosphocarrier protein [Candidatus Gemmiger faecigallinarum]